MKRTSNIPFIFGTRPIEFDPNNPFAHERIGALFKRIIEQDDFATSRPLLVELGIHPTDASGLEKMHTLIQQVKDAKILIDRQMLNGPIYQLKSPKSKDPIGLFKIGRKRAAMELLIRRVAHITGLAEHTTPGVFCALGNYRSLQWADVFEDLWNGQLKNYSDDQCSTYSALVGILEPFYARKEPTSLEEFAKMTLLALVVGLRDGKSDGYNGGTWFDCEDAFPIRLDPPDSDSIAATDLPYLSDSKASTSLPADTISRLKTLVQSWDLEAIRAYLGQATIDYADTKAEEIPFLIAEELSEAALFLVDDETAPRDRSDCSSNTDTDSENAQLLDEGHNAISLQKPDFPHAINGILNHWDIEQNPDRLCLLPAQITTTLERIRRIQDFFATTNSFCLLDLMFHVDPWKKTYDEFCTYLYNTPDSPLKREVLSDLALHGISLVTGRRTPSSIYDPNTPHKDRFTPLNASFHHTPKST